MAEVKINVSEGLLLYCDHFSFHSQKVMMALYEKNLPFEIKTVNLMKYEQYEQWFLELNPKGEVPVLQDDGKVIPDSARIIDYLEDNFSNGGTPRLIPMGQSPEIRQNVTHFRYMLEKLPVGVLTAGAMLHPGLLKNPKIPFIAPIRRAMANAEKSYPSKLEAFAERHVRAKKELLEKATSRAKIYKAMLSENNFKDVLDEIDDTLERIEEELSARQHVEEENRWLCSDRFTIADIELTILLERISQLGLEYRFWTCDKRPNLRNYYERVKYRDSYKKTIPKTLFFLKTLLISQAPIVIGVVAAVALIVGGVFIVRKLIS